MSRNCFTYLLGWSRNNKWYYGVRYALNCDPADLWTIYFTSSSFVESQRRLFGEPDVIEIRRTFGEDSKRAKTWEDKVLARLSVQGNSKWLNESQNYSFRGQDNSWNLGLTKDTCPSLLSASRKISKKRKGVLSTEATRKKLSESGQARKQENSWQQLLRNPVYQKFINYDDFISRVIDAYIPCQKIPLRIALRIGATWQGVATALKHLGLECVFDQRLSKLIKNYGDKFASYDDYKNQILTLHNTGISASQIAKKLGVNECGVKTVLSNNELTSNTAKSGPNENTVYKKTPGIPKGTSIWITDGVTAVRHDAAEPIPVGWHRGRSLKLQ